MANRQKPTAVMIIPTGAGCSIGGHAGDATPAARLLGSVCHELVLHPNVVNASDINEMPENALYVEGSLLDRFLEGDVALRRPRRVNRILLVANKLTPMIVNGVNAGISTLAIDVKYEELKVPLTLKATKDYRGQATGEVGGVDDLVNQVLMYFRENRYDALAVVTPVDVDDEVSLEYLRNGGVNPWGGVEAIASREIASRLDGIPVAHAPIETESLKTFNEVVHRGMGAEVVSNAYLNCVMKGLRWAPKGVVISRFGDLFVDDIDVLVSPDGCWGPPHEACYKKKIPILLVESNKTVSPNYSALPHISLKSYMEAAGWIVAMGEGLKTEYL